MNKNMPQIFQPIEQMLSKLNVNSVFGEPTREGEATIIPVAEIGVGFGYGYGFGEGPAGATAEGREAAGGGGGGGAGGKAIPRGYIRITTEGATFQPIVDEMRIPLAGIAMVAWSVFWISKTIRAFAKRKA